MALSGISFIPACPAGRVKKCFTPLMLLCAACMLSACTMAPKYERPVMPIPIAYHKGEALPGEGSGATMGWRDFFKNPPMVRLIELALQNNRDLRVAVLNIEKVRAQYSIQRADLLPTVAAAADATIMDTPAAVSATRERAISRQYTASLGFSAFELDLFGRVRSLTEQALETYYSVEDDAKAAQISLVAEVAGVYLQLVSNKELLDITQATVKNRERQVKIVTDKFKAGVASELEVSQARTLLEEAKSSVADYKTRVGQTENALQLLLGCPIPTDMPDVRKLSKVTLLADVPAGMPSELLERRPDIQAAEHRLMAYNANIGAARANFFPTVALTGAFGTLSNETSNLFSAGAEFWRFLPQVSLPIFDTGRNLARLEASETDKEIAVAQYEKSIQTAFREVMDTLVQRQHIGAKLKAQSDLLKAANTTYSLSSARYEAGVDGYLAVLDAQRTLYGAQQSYISAKLLRETNALTLYKALGGGWKETATAKKAASPATAAASATGATGAASPTVKKKAAKNATAAPAKTSASKTAARKAAPKKKK